MELIMSSELLAVVVFIFCNKRGLFLALFFCNHFKMICVSSCLSHQQFFQICMFLMCRRRKIVEHGSSSSQSKHNFFRLLQIGLTLLGLNCTSANFSTSLGNAGGRSARLLPKTRAKTCSVPKGTLPTHRVTSWGHDWPKLVNKSRHFPVVWNNSVRLVKWVSVPNGRPNRWSTAGASSGEQKVKLSSCRSGEHLVIISNNWLGLDRRRR